MEISGLNAEEQSDISLIANYSKPQGNGLGGTGYSVLEVYAYFDIMMILKENNQVELIQ